MTNPNTIKLLDHGWVTLRNIAGPTRRGSFEFDADDTDPANAARKSFDATDKVTITLVDGSERPRTRDDDLRLCDYLMRNWHTTPFEMVEVWLEMKMPIFLARQLIRHRTSSVDEVSARYTTLPAEWYIPEVVGGKSSSKKQGQENNLDLPTQEWFKNALHRHCAQGYDRYEEALRDGVAPEHARMLLSLNHYTHWIWKQDLHNLMHLMGLRIHGHAQIEAQAYGMGIYQLVSRVLPESMKLFDKYRRRA